MAANTQIGRENYQGVNTSVDNSVRPEARVEGPVETIDQSSSTTSVRPVARTEGPVETIDQSNNTTNNTEIDPLMLILLILGWLAPSPNEIARGVLKLFSRRKE